MVVGGAGVGSDRLIRVEADSNSERRCEATDGLLCCGSRGCMEDGATYSVNSERSIGGRSVLHVGNLQIIPKSWWVEDAMNEYCFFLPVEITMLTISISFGRLRYVVHISI